MPVTATPKHIQEQKINSIPNITFVRWDGEYHNVKSKAVCRCELDGFEWSARSDCVLSKKITCPRCAESGKRTSSSAAALIDAIPGITFVRWLDGNYVNSYSRVVCRCDVDGFEWSTEFRNVYNTRSGCPQCAGNRRWTASERIEQINAIPHIMFIRWDGDFKGVRSRAVCRCDIDGFEWSTIIDGIINTGRRCPECYRRSRNHRSATEAFNTKRP